MRPESGWSASPTTSDGILTISRYQQTASCDRVARLRSPKPAMVGRRIADDKVVQ
jgi:hypothetical protein